MQYNSNQHRTECLSEIFASLPVDTSLTVLNAELKGYEWSFDVNQFSPSEIIEVAIRLARGKRYKIGQARFVWFGRKEQGRGVYKPIKKQTEKGL